jgi:hypothetical protein
MLVLMHQVASILKQPEFQFYLINLLSKQFKFHIRNFECHLIELLGRPYSVHDIYCVLKNKKTKSTLFVLVSAVSIHK